MARAAKVPKVKERYVADSAKTENARGFKGTIWAARSGHAIALCSSPYADRKIVRALNILEAIERGELIVKEAE